MKTSTRGIALIKSFERLELRAYRCPAGVWTIGWGHTKGVKPGMVITEAEAEKLLSGDLRAAETVVNAQGLVLTQGQFDALVSFTFNLGGYNLRRSTLLRKVKVNPRDITITREFRKWVIAGGRVLKGLRRRREAEIRLYWS